MLRSIGIGARLWLFIAIPSLALVSLIAMLVWSDVETVRDLDDFSSRTELLADVVAARAVVQDERHALLDSDAIGSLEQRALAPRLLGGAVVRYLDGRQSTLATGDELITARSLAGAGRIEDSVVRYNNIITVIDAAISELANESPDGEIDRRSDALVALLNAEEAMLREDLELRLGGRNALAVARLHTTETEALALFAQDTSAAGHRRLETITIDPEWREAVRLRAQFLDAPTRGIDTARWAQAAEYRRAALRELIDHETTSLASETESLARRGLERLVWVAALVAAVLVVCSLAAFFIRRSIVRPLGALARAAKLMSEGQLEPIDDPGSDEIARVAQAFSSLHNTMESLWNDIDLIEKSVRRNDFEKRIDTADLEGDWRRLADTMNATLETGQVHSESVGAELRRRDVLAEISGSALVAESGPALTAQVLHHLPAAVPGSHAHLHRHPSGSPVYDLGVELEPSISALELPSLDSQAQVVNLDGTRGVASLVDFGTGPPAVLVLRFGDVVPDDPGPVVGLVETAAHVLAQGHRRQAAEWSATHNLEHDALTGLFNTAGLHRWFEENAADDSWAVIGVQPLRLDVLDSSHGRDARNALLHISSRRLLHALGEADLMARIGDPEFVMVTRAAHVDDLVQRVVQAFDHPLALGNELVPVEIGVGVSLVGAGIAEAVANAATAIRQGDGRNTTVVRYEDRLREDVVRQTEIERWLEQAIENHDLEVHFQPIVDAVTTEVAGYECLVRGTRNGVTVSPGEFIPLAEQSSKIIEIGDFVLREACAALPFLPGDSPYVSINLSPHELSDEHVIERINAKLDESGVDRSRIVLEITEGAATTDDDMELLHRIRGLGVKIAIDDFGSGHSNLSYLSTLPAQILKLDRSLVTPMTHDRNARKVVSGAIAMAHDIGMTVIGEGVETDDELNALRRVRCDLIQGYLTGRPAPLAEHIEVAVREPRQQLARTTIVPPEAAR